MTVLVYLEHADGAVDEPSLQAVTLARSLARAASVQAVSACGDSTQAPADGLGGHGVDVLHAAMHDAFATYAPRAIAETIAELAGRRGAAAVIGPGTERGNEVLAHVAALLDLPLAANCVSASGAEVTRIRWGGSLLEEARVDASPLLLTVQPHALAAQVGAQGTATVESFTPSLSEAALALRVVERAAAATGGVSLADAKVVVSGGRGAGSATRAWRTGPHRRPCGRDPVTDGRRHAWPGGEAPLHPPECRRPDRTVAGPDGRARPSAHERRRVSRRRQRGESNRHARPRADPVRRPHPRVPPVR